MYESACSALLSHHVLFSGPFYYTQTSLEMPLRLALPVIILHYLSELNAPRENIRFHARIRQRWIVNREDRDGSAGGADPRVPAADGSAGLVSLCYLEAVTQTWKLYLSLL